MTELDELQRRIDAMKAQLEQLERRTIGVVILALALMCWVLPARAASTFPEGTAIRLEVPGAEDCNDGSMLICITTLETQRRFLLTINEPTQFVGNCYRLLLRRAADFAALDYYVDRIKTLGSHEREKIIAEIVDSAEYKALHR